MNGEFSFSSQRSGQRQEDSILNEYKRLSLDQESFYFSIDPIAFTPLPYFLPSGVARQYGRCIFLENASFYEMFTFAVFEFLFRGGRDGQHERNRTRLAKLKELICSNNFLAFANFTKGLILKGLKAMAQADGDYPVAQVLMGSEKMPAFCECWKEMLFYYKSKPQEIGDINSSMLEVFTQFFEIDLRFYSRKGKEFLEQVVRGSPKGTNDCISILLISSSFEQDDHAAKEHSISSISSIYGNWSYYVLLPAAAKQQQTRPSSVELPLTQNKTVSKFRANRRATITLDYPELFAIDEEKSQIKSKINEEPCEALVGNARRVVERGFQLLEKMKDFTDKLGKS